MKALNSASLNTVFNTVLPRWAHASCVTGILLVVDDNPPELQMKKALDMFEEENYRYDKVQERETTSLFNEIDANNDGIISQEEFMESEKVQAHISELVKQANEPGHGRDEEIEL